MHVLICNRQWVYSSLCTEADMQRLHVLGNFSYSVFICESINVFVQADVTVREFTIVLGNLNTLTKVQYYADAVKVLSTVDHSMSNQHKKYLTLTYLD